MIRLVVGMNIMCVKICVLTFVLALLSTDSVAFAGDFEMREFGVACGEFDYSVISICENDSVLDCLYQEVLVKEKGSVIGKLNYMDFFDLEGDERFWGYILPYKVVRVRCLDEKESKIGLAIVTGGNCEECEGILRVKCSRHGCFDAEIDFKDFF